MGEPDWLIAKKGLKLLLNNDEQNAEELFSQYPEKLPVFCGHVFAVFMDALMTFEEDKLIKAIDLLKEVEKRCSQDTFGWFQSVRSRVFGQPQVDKPLAERLESEIILADSQVLLAILTFLHQDISGYIKGAWVLRKAWKIYQNAYNSIFNLYVERFGVNPNLPVISDANRESLISVGSPSVVSSSSSSRKNSATIPNGYTLKPLPNSHSAILNSNHHNHNSADESSSPTTSSGKSTPNSVKNNLSSNRSSTKTFLKKSHSVNSALYQKQQQQWSKLSLSLSYFTSNFHLFSSSNSALELPLTDEDVERLMGAVCFGYGLLHLGISLLPPPLLKISNLFGFSTSSSSGIQCLMFSRQGMDMRAPLATLALLWYHTIVRPFYAIDGTNVQAGVDAASRLLEESEKEYGQSALFLLFKGRVKRLNSDIRGALQCYQASVDKTNHREVKILAMHEVGWCHLIQLDYKEAESTFNQLKSKSRWSKNFYCYLEIVCGGCYSRNISTLELKKCMSQKSFKNNPIDEFLIKRAKGLPDFNNEEAFWRLSLYELLYLWNSLSSCNTDNIQKIITDCHKFDESKEPMPGLSKLILGSCYCIQNNLVAAIETFRKCIEIRKPITAYSDDSHISAFAHYELGNILIRNPDTKEEGRALLQEVYRYKGYDFENRLVLRVHSVLNHF